MTSIRMLPMSPQATTTKIGKTATLSAEFTSGRLCAQGLKSPNTPARERFHNDHRPWPSIRCCPDRRGVVRWL